MDHIKEILDRTNLQHMRSLLLEGAREKHISHHSYEKRLRENMDAVQRQLLPLIPDMQQREACLDAMYDYAFRERQIYLEIGMQCGGKLLHQLLYAE